MVRFADRKAQPARAGDRWLRSLRVRHAVLCLVVLVLVAIPPVFVNHPVGYIPLVAYLLVLVIELAYLRVVKRAFRIVPDFSSCSCTRGESVELPILLQNRSMLPVLKARPDFFVANPHGAEEGDALGVALVGAREARDVGAEVTLGHVGVYTAGLRQVVLFGPLGLLFARVEHEDLIEITSLPQPFDIDSSEFSRKAMSASQMPLRTVLSDDVDYAGTRDYEFGDPLKSIHWKLSARSDSLQTRLFETEVSTRTSVVMDFHGPDYEPDELLGCADAVVEVALATMKLAQSRGLDARLCYVDRSGAPVSRGVPERGEQVRFVQGLPLLSPQVSAKDAAGVVSEAVNAAGGSDNVVLCAAALTREVMAELFGARARHMNVSVVVVAPRSYVRAFMSENRGAIAELESAGIGCVVLSDAADLEVSRDED